MAIETTAGLDASTRITHYQKLSERKEKNTSRQNTRTLIKTRLRNEEHLQRHSDGVWKKQRRVHKILGQNLTST